MPTRRSSSAPLRPSVNFSSANRTPAMSEWILSEQRWTSTRSWVQRTLRLTLFCFLFSGLAAAGRIYWDSLKEWSPLQRVYFRQYLYSTIPKILAGSGQKMYVPTDTGKYVCYKCRNKIPLEDLEAVFAEQLKQYFLSPTDILQYLAEADHTIKEKQELLITLGRERQKVEQGMDKVYRAYINDEISMEGFGRQYKPLEARLKQLQDQAPSLQTEIDFL